MEDIDDFNPTYEDPLNPGLWIHDYCSCESGSPEDFHDYDCELLEEDD